MRRYEVIVITKPDLADEAQKAIAEKMKAVVTEGKGQVVHQESMGRQRLPFEIEGEMKGWFHTIAFEAESSTLNELERTLRLNESIVRHQSVRVDGDWSHQVNFMEKRQPFAPRGRGRDFGGPRHDDFGGHMGGFDQDGADGETSASMDGAMEGSR